MTKIEQTLEQQLSLLTQALAACLKEAAADSGEDGYRRDNELDQARKLARTSARLAEALARLKGQTRHDVHVTRGAG